MSMMLIDIYDDKTQAETRAEAYRLQGKRVRIEQRQGFTVTDCRQTPSKTNVDADGNPLHLVIVG